MDSVRKIKEGTIGEREKRGGLGFEGGRGVESGTGL